MSKLRIAVSKAHLQRLGQDVEPPTPPPGRLLPRGHKRRARAGDAVPPGSHLPANENDDDAKAPTDEAEPIRDARTRLRAMVKVATKDAPRASVGIVLAIVNQETGNHAAANALIDEYKLERLFGIKKFSRNG